MSGYTTLGDVSEAAVACRQLGYTSGETTDYILCTMLMIIAVQFTGNAYVSHDNTWTGGFVTLNCMNGMESSLEDCDPVKVITSREDTCKRGNQARLLCEPGIYRLQCIRSCVNCKRAGGTNNTCVCADIIVSAGPPL